METLPQQQGWWGWQLLGYVGFAVTLLDPGVRGGGANLTPPCANTYTCKRSLGRNSGNFSHIPKCMLGMLETTFHGQKSGDH